MIDLLNSKRFFSEYAKLSDEAEFINKEGYTQEKYEDIYMNEVKAFLTNMEQVYQSNPNHIPTIEVLKEDLIGFEGKSEFTQNRIQQILLNASWVSLRHEISTLKGFNVFYRELKELLSK